MSKTPVTEALEACLGTEMERLATEQTIALREAAAGNTDVAHQALKDASISATRCTHLATVLTEELDRKE